MAQGVAWWARRLGVPCTVVLPDTAPETKIAAIRRLGAEIDPGPVRRVVARSSGRAAYDGPRRPASCTPSATRRSWPATARSGSRSSRTCPTSTPSSSPTEAAGSRCGIASALRALAPRCKVFAAEVATGSAARRLARSRRADESRLHAELRRRDRLAGGVPGDVRAAHGARGRLARRGSTRSPTPSGCSPSAPASSPRARARAARRGANRRRRRRQGRLRRLRREHRRGEAVRDPRPKRGT